jgi:hypothetical protein
MAHRKGVADGLEARDFELPGAYELKTEEELVAAFNKIPEEFEEQHERAVQPLREDGWTDD